MRVRETSAAAPSIEHAHKKAKFALFRHLLLPAGTKKEGWNSEQDNTIQDVQVFEEVRLTSK